MAEEDAGWIDLDAEWGRPGVHPTKIPEWNPRSTTAGTPHDAADKLPTPTNPEPSSSAATVLALSISGVLVVVLVLILIYMFVLRKKYKTVKTQRNAAEYQVRIEDAAHVITNLDETCNTYVNTTDLQKLVNTVRAQEKSQERLPVPPRLQKPAVAAPSSNNTNNGFLPDGNATVRPPKPAPSHYKPPLVPPYETVVLNPEYNSKGNESESNGGYWNVNNEESSRMEPKFLIPFKTMSIEEAQVAVTTESLMNSPSSPIITTTISPIARPRVEPPKVPSTSSGTSAVASRPAPPPPNSVKKSESSHSIKKSASSDSIKAAPLTAPKPTFRKISGQTQPTPPTNQKPFTLATSTNSKPAAVAPGPPSNPKPSLVIPQPNPKPSIPSHPKPAPMASTRMCDSHEPPSVPSHPKPAPILPPSHTKPTPVISSNTPPQNKLLSSVRKGKLPLLPPIRTGLSPSMSRDASIDTPETAIEYLTPDCAETSPAKASISSKIAFLEGKIQNS